MYIRVGVTGTPNVADRATWPFPTAALFGYDPVAGTAIFYLPDADNPPNLPASGSAGRPQTPIGDVITGILPADLAAWKAAMGAKYPAWSAQFNPTVK